jgi:membrane-bound lytic murein transglycosylase D
MVMLKGKFTRPYAAFRWLVIGSLSLLLSGCIQPSSDPAASTPVDLTALAQRSPTPPPQQPTNTAPPPTQPPQAATPGGGLIPSTITPNVPPTLMPAPTATQAATQAPPPQVAPTQAAPTAGGAAQPLITVIVTPTAPGAAPATPNLLATPTALASDAPCRHTVQPGEWFYSIARKYNLNPVDLVRANPRTDPDALQPGDVLLIPNCNATRGAQPTPSSGTPGIVIVTPTKAGAAAPPGTLPTAIPVTDRIYSVADGDTLGAIARKFNTTVQAIKDANGLTSDRLSIGQKLKIPAPVR